jgi:hypothetical protein
MPHVENPNQRVRSASLVSGTLEKGLGGKTSYRLGKSITCPRLPSSLWNALVPECTTSQQHWHDMELLTPNVSTLACRTRLTKAIGVCPGSHRAVCG